MPGPSIVWFRRDLRLHDNPAFQAAYKRNGAIIPVYIWDDVEERATGAASRWWLYHSLTSLQKDLQNFYNLSLTIYRGDALKILSQLTDVFCPQAIYWGRLYEPSTRRRDEKIKESLSEDCEDVRSFNSSLLFEPWMVLNNEGRPFQVFTPYWRKCLASGSIEKPTAAPPKENRKVVDSKKISVPAINLEDLKLRPKIPWDKNFYKFWNPGEAGAQKNWNTFLKDRKKNYSEGRDFPALASTSELSPHLHFGEISPRQLWWEMKPSSAVQNVFLKEVGWREFAHQLLYHFPQTSNEPLREEFKKFPWREDSKGLRAWQRGETGFPIVDAGMRQLWQTGWMHNRVRMIVASFLVKDLLIDWRKGAEWFMDTLVDADLANNTLGWQWAGGCGADAAPYFRVFNPMLQGEKFDPNEDYIRRWVPDMKLDPIVDHKKARERALQAFAKMKG